MFLKLFKESILTIIIIGISIFGAYNIVKNFNRIVNFFKTIYKQITKKTLVKKNSVKKPKPIKNKIHNLLVSFPYCFICL